MARRRIAVLGAGGFAREVRWLIEEIDAASPSFEFAGYVVGDRSRPGPHDVTEGILGDEAWLLENPGRVDALAIGTGNPKLRLKIAAALAAAFPEDRWPALVHPGVRMDRRSATVEPGAVVCAGAVGTVNVVLRAFSMVNLCCTLGHECEIGRGSALNPTVNVSGGVRLGAGVLVGTGAQILENLSVGDGATVGAGAVVTRDVAAGLTVVGAPAKPLVR